MPATDLTPVNPLASVATMLATKALATAAGAMVAHGVISSSQTETFVSAGILVLSLLWSFWQEYGRAIVMAQLEVLKAKSLAQSAVLADNNLPKVRVSAIAAQTTMDPVAVVKAIETLPSNIAANVAGMPLAKGGAPS